MFNKNTYEILFNDRKVFCDSLIDFISCIESKDLSEILDSEEIDDTRVISIDATWGYGKTTFMQALKEKLEENRFTVFTFNAWKNDYEKDALDSFVSELIPQMMKVISYDEKNLKKKMKNIGNFLSVSNEVVKIITKIDVTKNVQNFYDRKTFIYNLLSRKKNLYIGQSPLNKMQNEFKNSLNIIYNDINSLEIEKTKKLPGFNTEEQLLVTTEQKIIILIDELDRCKPTFAIELLERVKHLFDTGRYLFIFAINSEQLKESVKQIYGNCFDKDGYFKRFFDYEFFLPPPIITDFVNDAFLKMLTKYQNNQSFTNKIFIFLLDQNLSLRKYNKVINEIDLFLKFQATEELTEYEITFITFIFIVKINEPKLFLDFFLNKESLNKGIKNQLSVKEEIEKYPNVIQIYKNYIPKKYFLNFKTATEISITELLNVAIQIAPINQYSCKVFNYNTSNISAVYSLEEQNKIRHKPFFIAKVTNEDTFNNIVIHLFKETIGFKELESKNIIDKYNTENSKKSSISKFYDNKFNINTIIKKILFSNERM